MQQQYELPLPTAGSTDYQPFPFLPLTAAESYNIVLRLDYEKTFPYMMPIGDILIEYYGVDDMMWDMLAVYIRIAYTPSSTDKHLWEFCVKVANDYLNGEELLSYVDIKASFDAGLNSVSPMVRLVTDQLIQRNHILNEVIPLVEMKEPEIEFFLICNCQPAINYAIP